MAPDVTFAWFIRHFTLLEELLLDSSQISSCLLSSNCLRLTFIKSIRMTRKMKNVVTSPCTHRENYMRSPAFVWSHLSQHPTSPVRYNLQQKTVTEQENCQDDSSPARKNSNLSFGRRKNFNGIISTFL